MVSGLTYNQKAILVTGYDGAFLQFGLVSVTFLGLEKLTS